MTGLVGETEGRTTAVTPGTAEPGEDLVKTPPEFELVMLERLDSELPEGTRSTVGVCCFA